MRFLKTIGVFLFTLLLVCMTPLVAAAASAEAVPMVGPAPLFHAVALLGLVGTVITLKAKDASGNKKSLLVDTEKPAEAADTIDQYAELKTEEAKGPLEKEITRLKAENKTLREAIGGEILRVQKLSAPKDKDGKETFNVESERDYLLGNEQKNVAPLEASRLVMEFQRLEAKRDQLQVTPSTTGDKPGDPNDPYKGITS